VDVADLENERRLLALSDNQGEGSKTGLEPRFLDREFVGSDRERRSGVTPPFVRRQAALGPGFGISDSDLGRRNRSACGIGHQAKNRSVRLRASRRQKHA